MCTPGVLSRASCTIVKNVPAARVNFTPHAPRTALARLAEQVSEISFCQAARGLIISTCVFAHSPLNNRRVVSLPRKTYNFVRNYNQRLSPSLLLSCIVSTKRLHRYSLVTTITARGNEIQIIKATYDVNLEVAHSVIFFIKCTQCVTEA